MKRLGPARRTGAVLVATLGILVTPLTVGAHAASHQSTAHRHVLPVTGTSKVLVYEQATHAISPFLQDSDSDLYALTSKHARTHLGLLGNDGLVTVVGSNVVIDNPVTVDQDYGYIVVRWWNLAAGQHGSFRSYDGYYYAAPNGWVYTVGEGGSPHIFWKTYAGTLTDLGDPQPIGTGYNYSVSTTGIVTTGNNDEDGSGQINYMSWSHPGKFRLLYNPGGVEGSCAPPSPKYVVCEPDYYKETLLPLNGDKPTIKAAACSRESEVLRASSVWMTVHSQGSTCPHGQLGSLSRSGKIKHSTRNFSQQPVVVALGRIVVATKNQHQLLTLTSVTAKPKPLHRS